MIRVQVLAASSSMVGNEDFDSMTNIQDWTGAVEGNVDFFVVLAAWSLETSEAEEDVGEEEPAVVGRFRNIGMIRAGSSFLRGR